jgi:3-hydroxymyristoyl/3-hydroxydecanoyl-(acyl carrier protein) dehydratase
MPNQRLIGAKPGFASQVKFSGVADSGDELQVKSLRLRSKSGKITLSFSNAHVSSSIAVATSIAIAS